MMLINCEVSEGPRAGFKAIGVPSIEGHTEYFTIEERFLVKRDEGYLLSVRPIGRDKDIDSYLVQLPVEADSGANRVWISREVISDTPDEIPA